MKSSQTNTRCDQCGAGCQMLSWAPVVRDSVPAALSPQQQVGLLRVVVWLFGVPLLLLLSAVWVLERMEMTEQPLWCGVLLLGMGWVVFAVARRHGGRLLQLIQPLQPERSGEPVRIIL